MKNIKRIIIVMCLVFVATVSNAQPPTPSPDATTMNSNRQQYSINRVEQGDGPIGTATGLLLCLAGGCVAYKLKRNTKQPQE